MTRLTAPALSLRPAILLSVVRPHSCQRLQTCARARARVCVHVSIHISVTCAPQLLTVLPGTPLPAVTLQTAVPQAVVNLDNARRVPGLGKVTEIPFVTQILQGILPSESMMLLNSHVIALTRLRVSLMLAVAIDGAWQQVLCCTVRCVAVCLSACLPVCRSTGLVLKIFLILMPPILGVMARFEGEVSLSSVDFSVGEISVGSLAPSAYRLMCGRQMSLWVVVVVVVVVAVVSVRVCGEGGGRWRVPKPACALQLHICRRLLLLHDHAHSAAAPDSLLTTTAAAATWKLLLSHCFASMPCHTVSRFFIFQVFATFIYQFLVGSALSNIQV
jgi:hypothetical protein